MAADDSLENIGVAIGILGFILFVVIIIVAVFKKETEEEDV